MKCYIMIDIFCAQTWIMVFVFGLSSTSPAAGYNILLLYITT